MNLNLKFDKMSFRNTIQKIGKREVEQIFNTPQGKFFNLDFCMEKMSPTSQKLSLNLDLNDMNLNLKEVMFEEFKKIMSSMK